MRGVFRLISLAWVFGLGCQAVGAESRRIASAGFTVRLTIVRKCTVTTPTRITQSQVSGRRLPNVSIGCSAKSPYAIARSGTGANRSIFESAGLGQVGEPSKGGHAGDTFTVSISY